MKLGSRTAVATKNKKADHVIKNFLTEKSINVLVKDMKKGRKIRYAAL